MDAALEWMPGNFDVLGNYRSFTINIYTELEWCKYRAPMVML